MRARSHCAGLVVASLVLTGCISRQVVVPGVELRGHVDELLRDGSAEARDRNGEPVTLSRDDEEIQSALARCQRPGQLGFTGTATVCSFKDWAEVRVKRADLKKSAALWGGALLVVVLVGTVVGLVVDADGKSQEAK